MEKNIAEVSWAPFAAEEEKAQREVFFFLSIWIVAALTEVDALVMEEDKTTMVNTIFDPGGMDFV